MEHNMGGTIFRSERQILIITTLADTIFITSVSGHIPKMKYFYAPIFTYFCFRQVGLKQRNRELVALHNLLLTLPKILRLFCGGCHKFFSLSVIASVGYLYNSCVKKIFYDIDLTKYTVIGERVSEKETTYLLSVPSLILLCVEINNTS